tara:strand:- start:90 stop:983 length:894 start_codon:yes stop_codon:yes gene_type:complete
MKVFVIYSPVDKPAGGGNQFIKMLKNQLEDQGLLAEVPDKADIFLFNSHHHIKTVHSYKKAFPNKKFVHRIDGPIRLYNNLGDPRDQQVYFANETFADATVYQSEWSKNQNLKMGLELKKFYTVIQNCSDDKIFFPTQKTERQNKTRLISSSWSTNLKKGFDFYKALDKSLDFNRYEYYFAGEPRVDFKNIKNLGVLGSKELANELRKSNIFITASENDPCSNALIEAVSCGLTCIALNSGGHSEIIKNNDLLFENKLDFLRILEELKDKPSSPETRISKPKEVTEKYFNFFNKILT